MTQPTHLGACTHARIEILRAQLIALHYINGFCPNFSRRLLKPISIERRPKQVRGTNKMRISIHGIFSCVVVTCYELCT